MTMFGRGTTPFKGGKQEKGPFLTDGKRQACTEAGPPMRLRGCGSVIRGFAGKHKTPGLAGGSLS